jgi:hypothetical protein
MAREAYQTWERKQLVRGLPVWTHEGLDRVYARMNQVRTRCKVPSLIDAETPFETARPAPRSAP